MSRRVTCIFDIIVWDANDHRSNFRGIRNRISLKECENLFLKLYSKIVNKIGNSYLVNFSNAEHNVASGMRNFNKRSVFYCFLNAFSHRV